jgi:hypothetical protein
MSYSLREIHLLNRHGKNPCAAAGAFRSFWRSNSAPRPANDTNLKELTGGFPDNWLKSDRMKKLAGLFPFNQIR